MKYQAGLLLSLVLFELSCASEDVYPEDLVDEAQPVDALPADNPIPADDPEFLEKKPNTRMCYLPGSPIKYFARHTDSKCSQAKGPEGDGKNLQTVKLNGRNVDLSKCENFTAWNMNAFGDICDHISRNDGNGHFSLRSYTMEELKDIIRDKEDLGLIRLVRTDGGHRAGRFALDGNRGARQGQKPHLYKNSTSNMNQYWVVKAKSNGYYQLKKYATSRNEGNYCLSRATNDNAILAECNDDNLGVSWTLDGPNLRVFALTRSVLQAGKNQNGGDVWVTAASSGGTEWNWQNVPWHQID